MEVLNQLVPKVVCNITPSYPLYVSPQYPPKPVNNGAKNVQFDKPQATHPSTKNLINLAKHKLTPNTLTLLEKGLSFIPGPRPSMSGSLNREDLHNKLTNFREKYIDRWVPSIPDRANRLINAV